MGDTTEISWCDKTFNPWIGCQKVSPACANCYAEREFDSRLKKAKWGPNGTRVLTSNDNWKKPLRWNRKAESILPKCPGCGSTELDHHMKAKSYVCMVCQCENAETECVVRPRVFCASLADVFEDWQGPMLDSKGNTTGSSMDDVRKHLFRLIDATPNLDWLLLTKRPENIKRMWPTEDDGHSGSLAAAIFGKPGRLVRRRDNVWLGASVESADYLGRIDTLKSCGDLASVLFLSCEPVVGPMPTLGEHIDGIDWVITGGESGPNARPSDPEWFRSLRDQCKTAGVPFHFKQWGEHDHEGKRVGKKAAGRVLDSVVHNAMPVLF